MPPRGTPPPKGSFYPPNDAATYRDLLLFEERLKTNALSLQRRKSRYQLFLVHMLIAVAFLLWEVLLPPRSSLLSVPYKFVLQKALPDIYKTDAEVLLHPYVASGLLFVGVTTLVLFFASGMYSEKIAYANKYVPHANRALRSFNMYFNVRKPPFQLRKYLNPLSLFSSAAPADASRSPTPTHSRTSSRAASPANPRSRSASTRSTSISTSVPISPIPPASNPRGELIFSSRIDKSFRDAYERYRATFERKREERDRMEKGAGWMGRLMFWRSAAAASNNNNHPAHVRTISVSSTSSNRGRISRSGTPPNSSAGLSQPSQSGMGTVGSGMIMMRQRERSGSPMRSTRVNGTPPPTPSSLGRSSRTRGETPPTPGGSPRVAKERHSRLAGE